MQNSLKILLTSNIFYRSMSKYHRNSHNMTVGRVSLFEKTVAGTNPAQEKQEGPAPKTKRQDPSNSAVVSFAAKWSLSVKQTRWFLTSGSTIPVRQ
jgi:hypothetical protein